MGGADGDDLLLEQQISAQARSERRIALPHGKVDSIRVEAGHSFGRGDAQINAGVGLGKRCQSGDEPFRRKGGGDTDRDVGRRGAQRICCIGHLVEGAGNRDVIGAPFFGKGQPARLSEEETQVQMVF